MYYVMLLTMPHLWRNSQKIQYDLSSLSLKGTVYSSLHFYTHIYAYFLNMSFHFSFNRKRFMVA